MISVECEVYVKIFLLFSVPSEVSRGSSWLAESYRIHPDKLLASRRLGRLRLVAIRRLFPAALSALCRCVRQTRARRHITCLATAVKIAFAWAPRREDCLNIRFEKQVFFPHFLYVPAGVQSQEKDKCEHCGGPGQPVSRLQTRLLTHPGENCS